MTMSMDLRRACRAVLTGTRLTVLCLVVVLAVSLLLGCGGSGATAPDSITGTWHLTTLNDDSLPTLGVTSGSLTLTRATFVARFVTTTSTDSVTGSYTVAGDVLDFTTTENVRLVGRVTGRELLVTAAWQRATYTR